MSELGHCFTMGKYALYVWPAYGVFALMLALTCYGVKRHKRRTRRDLSRWLRENQ